MTRSRNGITPQPSRFEKTEHIVIHGRHVVRGTEITVDGHGRQRFLAAVTNPRTGQHWIDTLDLRHKTVRSFPLSSVTRVHNKPKEK